jgi:hypothetical protein
MTNINTHDILDSINCTLREDYSSSLFNTEMSNKEFTTNLHNQLNIANLTLPKSKLHSLRESMCWERLIRSAMNDHITDRKIIFRN